jgi:hypothetical protein
MRDAPDRHAGRLIVGWIEIGSLSGFPLKFAEVNPDFAAGITAKVNAELANAL